MKHTHTIHTDHYAVNVNGKYVCQMSALTQNIVDADIFTYDDAQEEKNDWDFSDPNNSVVITPITYEMTTTDLYEAVADTLNNANGWDYQHCGRSRYEDATEMVSNLENHDFTAKEVSKFVKDFMAETETPPTIKDIAIGVADRVGAMITLNRYEDLTFHVNIK
jgi:hypothetical protein